MKDKNSRNTIIVRTSVIGIIVNVMLAGFKAAVGLVSHSIAIVLDAVNNLTDALSSIVTIGGAKYAEKKPDKDHPLGHGRIEYLSALVVAGIVLYAGITSLIESMKKIINPVEAQYTKETLLVITAAIAVKIILGRYVKKKGQETESGALVASGTDALSDAAISAGVLVTALIHLYKGLSLEAYMGVVISGFIIKAGIEMISDTIADILGRRANTELSQKIKELVSSEPEVLGVYDLFVHDYGPGRIYASVHVDLPDTMTVEEADDITWRITNRVYRETGVILTGIGIYSHHSDKASKKVRKDIEEIVMAHEWAMDMHGFHIDDEKKELRFDVVISFDMGQNDAVKILSEEIGELYPDYNINIVPDIDVSD